MISTYEYNIFNFYFPQFKKFKKWLVFSGVTFQTILYIGQYTRVDKAYTLKATCSIHGTSYGKHFWFWLMIDQSKFWLIDYGFWDRLIECIALAKTWWSSVTQGLSFQSVLVICINSPGSHESGKTW